MFILVGNFLIAYGPPLIKQCLYKGELIRDPQVWWISLLLLFLTTPASICMEKSRNLGTTFPVAGKHFPSFRPWGNRIEQDEPSGGGGRPTAAGWTGSPAAKV